MSFREAVDVRISYTSRQLVMVVGQSAVVFIVDRATIVLLDGFYLLCCYQPVACECDKCVCVCL